MNDRLHLSTRHHQVLEALIRQHLPGIEVWAYGSRVNGRSHDGSDLDLVLRAPGLEKVPTDQLLDFEDALRESSIPFLVEARDWVRLPEHFHREIERDHVVFLKAPSPHKNWPMVRLGDHVDSCLGKMLDKSKNRGELFPYLGNRNVRWGNFDIKQLGQMRFEAHEHGRYGLMIGDLVVCEGGEPGRCAIWTDEIPGMKIQKALHRLRTREQIDNRFLYYWFLLAGRSGTLESSFTGTTIKHLTGKAIADLQVPLPPRSEQNTIACILGTLDDKIELNRRMNETLEAMARAIFKDWFVDFGPTRAKAEGRAPYLAPELWDLFPDALDDEGKPVGWKYETLADVAKSPHRAVNPADVPDKTPYIGLEHMPRRSIALSEWGDAGKVKSNKTRFHRGEILFGKLRPYFHKVGVAPLEGICSTDIVVVVPRAQEWQAFAIACLSSGEFVDYTNRTSTGTKMPRTSWKTMAQYKMCLPSEEVVCAFQGTALPLLDRLGDNIHESFTLAQIQDLLLPKLLSGEIRLRDAEKVIEAVA